MLDPKYVENGCEIAKGATFMGEPLEDMTREELLAVAGVMAKENLRLRNSLHSALTTGCNFQPF